MKFKVLQKHFDLLKDVFELHYIDALNEEEAFKEIDETIATPNSQEWLLNEESFKELKVLISRV